MATSSAAASTSRCNGTVASAATTSAALQHDTIGYPERTFDTRILQLQPSAITFHGDGNEPFQKVALKWDLDSPARLSLQTASEALSQSHLVAFPTETVYGLGANALNASAATKIFRAKGRPVDNPLIVHISDMDMIKQLVSDDYKLSPVYSALVDKFWPGPMTLLLPVDENKVPSVVRCGLKTLGVRMPSHPVARALIAASGLPLAAPSANASGRPSPTTALHVFRDMTSKKGKDIEGRLPYILDGGPCHVGLESTVIDGVTQTGELRVLRPGGVGVEEIEDALRERSLLKGENGSTPEAVEVRVYGKDLKRDKNEENNPTTPGMKYRHYSPDAAVVLLVNTQGKAASAIHLGSQNGHGLPLHQAIESYLAQVREAKGRDVRVGLMSMDDSSLTRELIPSNNGLQSRVNQTKYFSLGSKHRPEQAAQRLFDGLRSLDEGEEQDGTDGCDVIFVEALNEDAGVGLAIMNRLEKAASKTLFVHL